MKITLLGIKRRNGHKAGDMCGVRYLDGDNFFTSPIVAECGEPAHRGWRCIKHWNEYLGLDEKSES